MWFPNRSDKTGLYKHRRWLETGNFGFGKYRNFTICVAKTKALISFAVTTKLISASLFLHMQIVGFLMTAHTVFSWPSSVLFLPV